MLIVLFHIQNCVCDAQNTHYSLPCLFSCKYSYSSLDSNGLSTLLFIRWSNQQKRKAAQKIRMSINCINCDAFCWTVHARNLKPIDSFALNKLLEDQTENCFAIIQSQQYFVGIIAKFNEFQWRKWHLFETKYQFNLHEFVSSHSWRSILWFHSIAAHKL